MADDTTNQDEAAQAAMPSVEQQDVEMTSTSDAPQTAEQRTAERRERRARNKAEYELERPIIDTGNRTSLPAMMHGANGAFIEIPTQRLGGTDHESDLRGTIGNRPETQTKDLDAPQTAEQRTAERRERRARHKEEYDRNRPIINTGNSISLEAITRGVDGGFAGFRAVNHTGGRQTDLRGTVDNRPQVPTKDLDAPQTAEQQAIAARRARRKEALSIDRPTLDVGNKISTKVMLGGNGAFTSLRAVNHTGDRQTDLRGTISNRPEIPTKAPDAAQSFFDKQLRNVKAGDIIRVTFTISNDDGVMKSHSVYNSAEVQQNKREQHLMGHRKPERDDSPTISERDDDAMDMDADRQRKRHRGDGFQAAAPSQGGFYHKHRRGRRGQRSSKKTQSQAPVFQQQGNQNSPWANPKPSNPRPAAFTAPNPDITKTPSSSFAYGQPVMSQASRSQPDFQSKPFSAPTNAKDQQRLFLGQPKPTPTTDAIPVKTEKEEDDYYTSSLPGHRRPFRDFQ